ncbi:MAG: YdcF family protein [Salibacteraceae bacterium]
MPLSWIVICLIISFIWKSKSKFFIKLSLGFILFFGNSFILHEVNLIWEPPILTDQNLDQYKAAVVLGGYAYYSPDNDRITFRKSSDRIMQGIRMVQGDYCEHLILSGGSGYLLFPDQKESIYVAAYLQQIGIDQGRVIVESESRNTYENAIQTAEILKERSWKNEPVLLITSAYHMRRAQACFEHQGINIIPYVSEPRTGERIFTLDHLLLPRAENFMSWNILIHEWVGYFSYKLNGYID